VKRFKNILLLANQGSGDHQLANQTRAIHKKRFGELIGNYALKNLNHRLHFLKGDPAALITDLAAEHRIDLIVMGTVCRTGVMGFFYR
jgi:nucleotide-binding universal stress UspA family protein